MINSVVPSTSARMCGVAVDRLTFAVDGSAPVPFSVDGGVRTPRPAQGQATREAPVVAFGVGPMGVPAGGFTSTLAIEITRDGEPEKKGFLFTPVLERRPGRPLGRLGPVEAATLTTVRRSTAPGSVAGTLAGFAAPGPARGRVPAIERSTSAGFLLDMVPMDPAFTWETGGRALETDPRKDSDRLDEIRGGLLNRPAANARNRILAALAIDPATVQLDGHQVDAMTDGFHAAPDLEGELTRDPSTRDEQAL